MGIRLLNPIALKINKLVASGRTTKEKICVAADLRYPTFQNIWGRHKISKGVLQGLFYAGIITEADKLAYREWCLEHKIHPDRRGQAFIKKRKEKTNAARRSVHVGIGEEQAEGVETEAESEVQYDDEGL